MRATLTAFRAYFGSSALLTLRGAGVGWFAYLFSVPIIVNSTWFDDGSGMTLFWCLYGSVLLANQLTVFLHRLTVGVPDNLVPGYRRTQWRAFSAVCLIAVGASTVLFWLAGLGWASSVAAALFIVALTVWMTFTFRYGQLILLGAAVLLSVGNGLSTEWMRIDSFWFALAGLVGIGLLLHARRQYKTGATIQSAARQLAMTCQLNPGNVLSWRFMDRLNQRLFTRGLDRPVTGAKMPGRLAAAYYTPAWGSGLLALAIFLVAAGFMGVVMAIAGGSMVEVVFPAMQMSCVVAAFVTTGRFEGQRNDWSQYWMMMPADDRRRWTTKIVAAYLLVQARCFLAIAIPAIALSLVGGIGAMKTGDLLGTALALFLLVSATTLVLQPVASRVNALTRVVLFFLLCAAGVIVGAVVGGLSMLALPFMPAWGAGLSAVILWSVVLTAIAVRRLPKAELSVKDTQGMHLMWGM